MRIVRFSLIGLVMMLAVTGSVFAQGNGDDDFIDFDIINVVDDGEDQRDDGIDHEWPWQVSLIYLTQADADTGQSEGTIKSGDRFFFTHGNTP